MASQTFTAAQVLTAAQMNTLANTVDGYATTATAAGTTTLTVASYYQQFFTGSTTQTVVMPVASTLVVGWKIRVVNNSSGIVTVQSSGANTIYAVPAGGDVIFTCILASGTTAASWDYKNYIVTSSVYTPATVYLGADVTLAAIDTFYDGPSTASLVNGATYLVSAMCLLGTTASVSTYTAKIWDATTTYAENETAGANAVTHTLTFAPFLYTAGSTTALKISVATNDAGGTAKIRRNPTQNTATSNKGTYITVQRIS